MDFKINFNDEEVFWSTRASLLSNIKSFSLNFFPLTFFFIKIFSNKVASLLRTQKKQTNDIKNMIKY